MIGLQTGKEEENVGAAWYDAECRVVNERAQAARRNLRDAKRAVPPLQKVELDAMHDQVKTMRSDFQRMARRKQTQQKHDVQKQLIRDYYSSSPKNFWDVFKKGLQSKCELDDVPGCPRLSMVLGPVLVCISGLLVHMFWALSLLFTHVDCLMVCWYVSCVFVLVAIICVSILGVGFRPSFRILNAHVCGVAPQ